MIEAIRKELAANVDPAYREGARKYSKETVEMWGVRAPVVHRIARDAAREVKNWPAAERARWAEALWSSGQQEEAGIVIYVYRQIQKRCGAEEFELFERWIDKWVTNWATCDGVSAWLLAAAVAGDPELLGRLEKWTASKNRWKRRAAAVALLQEAKRGRNTADVLRILDRLIEDADDMVRKGVGWVLKEAYPKRPREVVEFLLARAPRVPRLVLRLAAEKMSKGDREKVLT